MAQLSPILRGYANGVGFWCPGCREMHMVQTSGSPSWSWNGSVDRPTFQPSIFVRSGHYVPGYDGGGCWCTYRAEDGEAQPFECVSCHTFVTDGMIQFLSDCSHHLAGQTVPIPPLPERLRDDHTTNS